MKTILALFALLIVLGSATAVVIPSDVLAFAVEFLAVPGGVWMAAAIRLVLAVLLWFSAPESRTPTTFKVLAVIVLLAAIGILVAGADRLLQLLEWFAAEPLWVVRAVSMLGLGFGAFVFWSASSKGSATNSGE